MKSYVIDFPRAMDRRCDSIQMEFEKFGIEFEIQ